MVYVFICIICENFMKWVTSKWMKKTKKKQINWDLKNNNNKNQQTIIDLSIYFRSSLDIRYIYVFQSRLCEPSNSHPLPVKLFVEKVVVFVQTLALGHWLLQFALQLTHIFVSFIYLYTMPTRGNKPHPHDNSNYRRVCFSTKASNQAKLYYIYSTGVKRITVPYK